jgi:uncharacterized protein involved in exopolysaccharide biosynthesis
VTIPRQVSEALLLSLAGGQRENAASDAIARELLTRTEVMNPVYAQLEIQAATLRTNVAALDAEQRELADQLRLAESPSRRLTTVYERESQIARLERELVAAERVVASLSASYQQAHDSANAFVAQPEIIDPASVPDVSTSRGMIALTVAGLLAGFLAATTFVLGRALMARVIRPLAPELT